MIDIPVIAEVGFSLDESVQPVRAALRYEEIIAWGEALWQENYPGVPFVTLWASEGPASSLARQRIKPGRKLTGTTRYIGYRPVHCPLARRINSFFKPGRKVLLSGGTGAILYTFERAGKQFDALYVSVIHTDKTWNTLDMVFVPEDQLEVWAKFEDMCDLAANYLERSPRVYIIGAQEESFEPKVAWEDVILSEALKADVRTDVEGFFRDGVDIYKELGLTPFRKLLFVGPPGTGKSTLCVALAKLALEQRNVVVYVSSSDKECGDDTNFDNVRKALRTAGTARYPVLLIIEDLDAYLMEKDEKSQILNVLDGFEAPNNPHGVLLVATTNYPEIIDERITKRPGRVDRVFYVPPIEDNDQAVRMLKRYMGAQWRDDHSEIAPKLIGQTGVFVREVALCARILAANNKETSVSLDTLRQSLQRLLAQLATGIDLRPRRAVGFEAAESSTREVGLAIYR